MITGKENTLFLRFTFIFFCIATSLHSTIPKFKAKSYILKSIKSNVVHLEKSPKTLYPMASLTKLGTALLSSESLSPDSYVKVSNGIAITNNYESRADLKEGEEYRVSDLFYGLLLPSGNDVARLLAKELENKEGNFSRLSEKWKMENSIEDFHFEEPVGLSSNSKASAIGMIKILDKIYNSKTLFTVIQTKEYSFSSKNNHKLKVVTRTPIHESSGIKIFGKTGKTKSAGLCFAGFLKKNDTLFQIVILGSEDLEYDLVKFSEYLSTTNME